MKIKMPLLLALLALPLSAVMAQDKVIAPSPSSRASLDLYEQPGSAQPVRQISVSEAGLPLAIQSTQTGYHKVAIAGRDYWLRGMQVRISRDTTAAGCGTSVVAPAGATIATPGAGKDACK
ncbi:hypothetical protein LHU53_18585 [Rhodoferax sp. U2-2l]|uniref:hypothetical protein n=1 Tax=Rhodoferax sp. U2-2l TaxID=2884000 RepID=UPI001D0B703B|nr:hypothetical protein [Rhodoferax sp. U2-2l]MCB8748901.1 hypothetical protein [Rhodoferax sp. U2-2l]